MEKIGASHLSILVISLNNKKPNQLWKVKLELETKILFWRFNSQFSVLNFPTKAAMLWQPTRIGSTLEQQAQYQNSVQTIEQTRKQFKCKTKRFDWLFLLSFVYSFFFFFSLFSQSNPAFKPQEPVGKIQNSKNDISFKNSRKQSKVQDFD